MLAYMNDTSNPRNAYPAFWAPFEIVVREDLHPRGGDFPLMMLWTAPPPAEPQPGHDAVAGADAHARLGQVQLKQADVLDRRRVRGPLDLPPKK
jgi:hypothetical protein